MPLTALSDTCCGLWLWSADNLDRNVGPTCQCDHQPWRKTCAKPKKQGHTVRGAAEGPVQPHTETAVKGHQGDITVDAWATEDVFYSLGPGFRFGVWLWAGYWSFLLSPCPLSVKNSQLARFLYTTLLLSLCVPVESGERQGGLSEWAYAPRLAPDLVCDTELTLRYLLRKYLYFTILRYLYMNLLNNLYVWLLNNYWLS